MTVVWLGDLIHDSREEKEAVVTLFKALLGLGVMEGTCYYFRPSITMALL
jgi:hypothetical protein